MIKPNWKKRNETALPSLPSREILAVFPLNYNPDTPLLIFLSNPKSKLPLSEQEKQVKRVALDVEKAWGLWKKGTMKLTKLKAVYTDASGTTELRQDTFKDIACRLASKGKMWSIGNIIIDILTGNGYEVYCVDKDQYLKEA